MKTIWLLTLFFAFSKYSYSQDLHPIQLSPAEFQGGQVKLYKFLSKNVKYPETAKRDKVEGVVLVSFIVKSSGALDSVDVVDGIRADLDMEAIRVVKKMPRWKPGKNEDGEAIPTRYRLPIRFKL